MIDLQGKTLTPKLASRLNPREALIVRYLPVLRSAHTYHLGLCLRWGITSLASNSIDRMILSCGVVYICMNSNASSTPASARYWRTLPQVSGLPMQAPPALTISSIGTVIATLRDSMQLLHEEFV